MPDLKRVYPDQSNDINAVISLQQNGGSSINYSYIGRSIMEEIGEGGRHIGRFVADMLTRLTEWLIENTAIDQDFLDDLGKQETPFWGADSWHPVIAPEGFIDRYRAAGETIGFGLVLIIARIITGRIGVSGIASFVGGQYSSWSQRQYRNDVKDLLEENLAAELQDDADFASVMDRALARDGEFTDSLARALRALADNRRHQLLFAASEIENVI